MNRIVYRYISTTDLHQPALREGYVAIFYARGEALPIILNGTPITRLVLPCGYKVKFREVIFIVKLA